MLSVRVEVFKDFNLHKKIIEAIKILEVSLHIMLRL